MVSRAINALPLLHQLAARRAQPVTIFDLETTTNIPYVEWMGITEVGMLTIYPDGRSEEESAFVDPERNIPPRVRELTGIMNEDVRGQPTWDTWKERFHRIASERLVVGYNCTSFDCIVVVKQSERYGLSGTLFEHVLDAKALPEVRGKLRDAAEAFGVKSETYHRAMADVWTTAMLVEAVAVKHGLDAIETCIGKRPTFGKRPSLGGGGTSPRQGREAELTAYFGEHGSLPDLERFAESHGIRRQTLEADVIRLIGEGNLPKFVLDNVVVQDWLAQRIEAAIVECWVGEAEGRLKPLFERFQADAPGGFDYTQLKVALAKR